MLTLTVRGAADPAGAELLERRVVAYDSAGAPVAYGARRSGGLWLSVPGIATFHVAGRSAVVTASADQAAAPEAVFDAYYGTALPLVVQATRGLQVLHASAVVATAPKRVVAFCGVSGTGKSTLANALAARGYRQWADDAVVVDIREARAAVSVGLPFLARRVAPSEVVADFAWKRAPLGAIFLLDPIRQPAGRAPSVAVERMTAADALGGLLRNAFRFQPEEPDRRRETLRAYLDLAASVPVFRARFARGLDRLPNLLDELERSLRDTA